MHFFRKHFSPLGPSYLMIAVQNRLSQLTDICPRRRSENTVRQSRWRRGTRCDASAAARAPRAPRRRVRTFFRCLHSQVAVDVRRKVTAQSLAVSSRPSRLDSLDSLDRKASRSHIGIERRTYDMDRVLKCNINYVESPRVSWGHLSRKAVDDAGAHVEMGGKRWRSAGERSRARKCALESGTIEASG